MTVRKVLSEKISVNEMYKSHATAKEIRDYCYLNQSKLYFDSAFKFAFIRNPFDWVVSLYEFIRKNESHENYEEIKSMTFDEFCMWNVKMVHEQKENNNGSINNLSGFLLDDDGKLIVDFVGRMENYDNDMRFILGKLGMNINEIPKINVSERKPDYRDYYNDFSRSIIEEGFADDLKYFNYSF